MAGGGQEDTRRPGPRGPRGPRVLCAVAAGIALAGAVSLAYGRLYGGPDTFPCTGLCPIGGMSEPILDLPALALIAAGLVAALLALRSRDAPREASFEFAAGALWGVGALWVVRTVVAFFGSGETGLALSPSTVGLHPVYVGVGLLIVAAVLGVVAGAWRTRARGDVPGTRGFPARSVVAPMLLVGAAFLLVGVRLVNDVVVCLTSPGCTVQPGLFGESPWTWEAGFLVAGAVLTGLAVLAWRRSRATELRARPAPVVAT